MTERNAPCPCGSGKKYKRCCGETGPSAASDPISLNRAIAYRGDIGRRRENFCREYIATKREVTGNIEQSLKQDAAALEKTISCAKGCGTCCNLYIAASLQECEAIVYHLYQHEAALRHFLQTIDAWRDKIVSISECFSTINSLYGKKILSQATEEEKQTFRTAMDFYETRGIPCPFLVDNACSIYEVRPYVCSGVVSVSPADWCQPSHPEHNSMKYLKNSMRLDKDMPYFVRPDSGVFFGNMPLFVNDILAEGYAALSAIPGLQSLQGLAFSDAEVLAEIRRSMKK